jgi:hypothetical protein
MLVFFFKAQVSHENNNKTPTSQLIVYFWNDRQNDKNTFSIHNILYIEE